MSIFKLRNLALSSLVISGGLLLSSLGSAAQAFYLGGDTHNFGSHDVGATINLFQDSSNDVRFEITVDDSVNMADITGVFFNLKNESLLPGLSQTSGTYQVQGKGRNDGLITKDYVSGSQFGPANSVNSINGRNLNGSANAAFDGALAIGATGKSAQGIADDHQFVSFTLSHSSGLKVDDFIGEDFGLRMQSVGDSREGSAKLIGQLMRQDVKVEPPAGVPEPATLAALGVVGLGLLKVKRNPGA